MTGSLDKAHIDSMYKLSLIESAIDFTYSALESKIDCVYSNLSIVDSIQSSQIEEAESIIRSEINEAESILTSEIEFTYSGLSSIDSVIYSELLYHHSVVESKLDVIGYLTESKLDNIGSDVDAVKSDLERYYANLNSDVSTIESKIEGPVYSQLQGIKDDIATGSNATSAIESKLDAHLPLLTIHVNTLLNDVSAVESKLDGNFPQVLWKGIWYPIGIATYYETSLIESKIDGPVYSELESIKLNSSELNSAVMSHITWVNTILYTALTAQCSQLTRDVSAIESKLDETIPTRSGGSIVTNYTEQMAFEESAPTGVWRFNGGSLDLNEMAAGDEVILRIYECNRSGGVYRVTDSEVYRDVQDLPLIKINETWNRYGLKVTMEHTATAVAAISIWYEWFE